MSADSPQEPLKNKRNLGVAFFIIGLSLVGAVIVFYLSNLQQNVLQASEFIVPPAVVSFPAPQFSLTALDARTVSLADFQGKVVLVNNWATWCPPCKAEMPELEAYYTKHSTEGFVVVAVESGEPAPTVAEYAHTYQLSFPILLDPSGTAVDAFKNWDLPSSYLIDRQGMVRMSWTGPVNQVTLEKYVTPLLEK